MRRSSSSRGIAVALLAIACCALTGCSFLADEFSWLDRRPPPAADGGVGVAERP
jgi:hypothetical protein